MTVELIERAPLKVTPKLGKGMGHKPGGVWDRTKNPYTTRHLFGATRPGSGTSSADLSAYIDRIRDQTSFSCCVGMANARIVHITAQVLAFGKPNPGAMPYPAEMGIYGLAREEDGEDPLTDDGSQPAQAINALQNDIGVPLERDFPFSAENINRVVPPDVLAKALAVKVEQAYLIDSEGTDAVNAACQALENNRAVAIAIQVGQNYEGATAANPVVMPETGQIYGGHDVTLVGYRIVNGRRQFLNASSWGTEYGLSGYVWLDEGWVSESATSDRYVVDVVPNFSLTAAHKALIASVESKGGVA